MRNCTKLTAVLLVVVMAISVASCSLTPQYSYKTADTELPIGVYIYSLYSAYKQAESFAQKTEAYDSEKEEYNGEKSFLNIEITDDDGKTATADQWITEKADESMRTILAVEHEFNRLGATIDQETLKGYEDAAKEYWDYGPYYAYYGEQYKNPYSEIFEPLGVSFDSFYKASYYVSAMQEAVFKKIYGEGGTKEVSDKDLTSFFTENYTSYTYFSANLYTTETQTIQGEDGATSDQEVSVSFSEADIKKYTNSFKSYVDLVKNGATASEVSSKYMADYSVEQDPSTSAVEVMADSSIGEDLIKEINNLKEGTASYKIIGEDNSKVIYFFYKQPIKEQIDSYIGGEDNREKVLQKMKNDEFTDDLKKIGADLELTISSACDKYKPEMFDDLTTDQQAG